MFPLSILVTIMLFLLTEINSEILPKTNCPTSCGNLTIPFPFGTSSDCCFDDSFLISCIHSHNATKPFLNSGSIEVLEISLDGLLKVASFVASDCYEDSGAHINETTSELTLSNFPISSTRNKFTAIGCDTYALIEGSKEWKQMSAGCVSWCDSIDSVVNGTCSGIGCCQTSIPKGVKDFLVDIRSFRNHTTVNSFNPCSYAFVVEAEAFEFSSSDLKNLRNRTNVPVVLDWSVGNVTCEEARLNFSTYACRAIHSECSDSRNGFGYRCNCLTGFQGNPYLVDGCEDVDECTSFKPCEGTCANLLGNYSCSCPKGFEGDGKKDGTGCHHKSRNTLFYIVSGLMVPAVGSSWIFWRRKEKKVAKLRQNLFERNGGYILENMLSGRTKLQLFTAEDLKTATNNYDENNILHGEQHFMITYKGILSNQVNRIVTIKKFDSFNECNLELFISNLVTFSQINHRNIVPMIGCCLETQVPLLVYEFFSAKTLYDYIHDDGLVTSLTWDVRLKIAAETAGALAYMHSAAAQRPVIHGHLTSLSILLHHGYLVKVDDFALTRSEICGVPVYIYEAGYVDPEYLISGRPTVKSDVYSFGVVLAELLTGKTVFVSLPRRDDLLRILDHRLVAEGKTEQLIEVAKLAQRCLSDSSMDRPTMKEVAIALEYVISWNSSSTTISPNSSQVTTTRRAVRRNRSF